jgi:hypothetical protein
MSWPRLQAIDCDIHPSVPSMRALLPYLDDHWRETVEARGIASLESISYPRHAPLTARPDWRDESGQAATDLAAVRTQLLDHFGVRLAVCNCLYGVQLVFDAYMARAFARAVNDWIAKKWLDPEPQLRAANFSNLRSASVASTPGSGRRVSVISGRAIIRRWPDSAHQTLMAWSVADRDRALARATSRSAPPPRSA